MKQILNLNKFRHNLKLYLTVKFYYYFLEMVSLRVFCIAAITGLLHSQQWSLLLQMFRLLNKVQYEKKYRATSERTEGGKSDNSRKKLDADSTKPSNMEERKE